MLTEWTNEAGYTLRLFKGDNNVSLMTLVDPEGTMTILRYFEYYLAYRARYTAEVLAEAMGAKEVRCVAASA